MISQIFVSKKIFRNVNHAIWFFMSVFLFILTVAYYFFPDLEIVILLPIGIHLFVMLEAIYVVVIKKQESETLSKACIRFNLFMLIIYLYFFYIIHF